jgi:hypothetical protein
MKTEEYPTVTEILSVFGKWDEIDHHILAHAAARGNRIHMAIAQYLEALKNHKDPTMATPDIEPDLEIAPYIKNVERWLQTHIDDVFNIEERLYDDELGLSGQCDAVVKVSLDTEMYVGSRPMKTLGVLIDWKATPYVQPTWPLQAAAYWHLLNVNGYGDDCTIQEAWIVQVLKKDPGIKIIRFTRTEARKAWTIYHGLLDAWHYLRKRGYRQTPTELEEYL